MKERGFKMPSQVNSDVRQLHDEEIELKAKNGMAMLLLNIVLMIAALVGFIYSIILLGNSTNFVSGILLIVVSALYLFFIGPLLFVGLKILKPNEALVLTLFGRYYGTLKGEGFFFVNPFVAAVNPAAISTSTGNLSAEQAVSLKNTATATNLRPANKKVSLKAMTLNNDKQKINDQLGNPIIIGIVVIWKVVNTAKAVFNVDNYMEFLSIQCDSALRNIVRLYPYDLSGDDNNEKTLRAAVWKSQKN